MNYHLSVSYSLYLKAGNAMKIDTEDLLNSINQSFKDMKYIKLEDIPSIDLYMDQVTTFLDEGLKSSSRTVSDEKLMTKTMINNYAKNEVIPPPINKKYSKEHVLVLIMLYYYKSFLQINDIKELFDPISEKMFGNKDAEYGLENLYEDIFSNVGTEIPYIHKDVLQMFKSSQTKFMNVPEENREYLQLYSFVCMLGCDVFVKKLLIEKIVDSLRDHSQEEAEGNSEGNKKDKKDKKEKK